METIGKAVLSGGPTRNDTAGNLNCTLMLRMKPCYNDYNNIVLAYRRSCSP